MTRKINRYAVPHVPPLSCTYMLLTSALAQSDPECNLYMAPSTVDPTTLAYFTAIPLAADTALPTSPDMSVNLIDFDVYNPASIIDEVADPDMTTLPKDYYFQTVMWHSDFLCGIRQHADSITTAISGFGMFGTEPPPPEDDSLISRLKSGSNIDFDWVEVFANCKKPYPENPNTVAVQRGAMSENLPLIPKTTVPIAAGSELFLEMGDDLDESAQNDSTDRRTAKFKLDTERAAMKRADETCTKFVNFVTREGKAFTPEMASDLWDIVRNQVTTSRLTRNYLPRQDKDVPHAAQYGVSTLIPPKFGYEVDWLRENGRCADAIQVLESSIEGAGRGAFVRRRMSKGDFVAPVPLLHIADSKMMNLHPKEKGENGGSMNVNMDIIAGTQLFINYCFAHPRSTLLLFPSGNGVNYINHSHNKSPNVRMQWSQTLRDELLQMSIEELTQSTHNHAGSLVMDLVALRDIEAGEELFMDYGIDYERAWKEHVQQHSQHLEWNGYQSATMLNYANETFHTYQEQPNSPYGTNVKIVVSWVIHGLPTGYNVVINSKTDRESISSHPDRIHDEVNTDKVIFMDWKGHSETFNGEYMRDCIVLERIIDQTPQPTYTLLLLELSLTRKDEEIPQLFPLILRNVPQSAIQFLDLPYTIDQHLRNAFRHSMALPDGVFPDAWKNSAKEKARFMIDEM